MSLKKVFLLSGPPGCGKSTFVRNVMTPGCEWISRDNVRFAFLKPGEDYFAHEDEVFDTFINYINQTLEQEDIHTIYIDATHLNEKSRNKTLRRIYKNNIEELNCLCFTTPKEVCHARNNLREGRSKVPATIVDNMFASYVFPNKNEGFNHIYNVDQDGNIKEVY